MVALNPTILPPIKFPYTAFELTPFVITEPGDDPNFITELGMRFSLVGLRGLNAQRGLRFAREL
jgi:hypothetical protein